MRILVHRFHKAEPVKGENAGWGQHAALRHRSTYHGTALVTSVVAQPQGFTPRKRTYTSATLPLAAQPGLWGRRCGWVAPSQDSSAIDSDGPCGRRLHLGQSNWPPECRHRRRHYESDLARPAMALPSTGTIGPVAKLASVHRAAQNQAARIPCWPNRRLSAALQSRGPTEG